VSDTDRCACRETMTNSARPSKWGNPFKVGVPIDSKDELVQK
jgi:hypothetical protein